jgi:hypothetical protein
MSRIHVALLVVALVAAAGPQPAAAAAPVSRKICVYDPSGANGDAFNAMKDYQAAALAWGVKLTLEPYTDEKTAAEDFKAGKCDAALLTGVRARAFNKFTGSLEAMGAVPSYAELHTVIALLASPKAASRMRSGEFDTVGIFPAGAVYLYLRNRKLKDVGDLAGKRIATLAFDQAAVTMVNRAGASLVPADIGTFSGMFNNGSVDVCYAPATAYQPLELQKGLAKKGGIARYPLAQLTLQLLARVGRFPDGFGNASRQYAANHFNQLLSLVKRAEKAVPAHYWIDITGKARTRYDNLFRDVRIKLRNEGVYDATMLTLLRRVRCRQDPARAECAQKEE